jgi:hypothetical protein
MKAGDAAIISKNPGILEASRHQNFRVASEAGVLSVAGHIRSAIQLRKNRHLRRPSRSAQEPGLPQTAAVDPTATLALVS